MKLTALLSQLTVSVVIVNGQKILVTNDDGWAVANVRAWFTALNGAGYDTVLSCPAVDKSGTGSSTTTPTPLTTPCEFNTCPTGSPAEGFNASDPRLNYVNAFPVDAAHFGIQTLAPKFFGSAPDLAVSGPNVGQNAGSTVLISGTVGAACEAAKEGVPAISFSGAGGGHVSYTTLDSSPNSSNSQTARIFAALSLKFTNTLLASSVKPILPPGIVINVNYPAISNCPSASSYSFVFARINANSSATDVQTCGSSHLPTENTVLSAGCFASVSVYNASTKADVGATMQQFVLNKVSSILTCLP